MVVKNLTSNRKRINLKLYKKMSATNEMFLQIQEEMQNTVTQVEQGELSHLDALIQMRNNKNNAEKVLELVKAFEDDHYNKIVSEAESYGGKYLGFEIKAVSGRQTYSFKNIPIVNELEQKLKDAQEFYKSGFVGHQKGTVQAKEVDGVWHFIDVDGDLQPFPELNIGKSYLIVKVTK